MSFIIIEGKVKNGLKRGRRLGWPTINIPVPKSIKKNQWGVYFSLVTIGGKIYPGATHLGEAKTFRLSRATCETYLLTLRQDLYGKKVSKKLIFKLRDVEDFGNVKNLKKQIQKDINQAKKFFGL